LASELQELGGHENPKGGTPMSRALVTNDWRELSKAARQERDPKKFVYLLKRLYDVVNEGEEKRSANRETKLHRAKKTRVESELEAA
jgi:hypothetical protein